MFDPTRRAFLKYTPLLIAGTKAALAAGSDVIAETTSGKVRGTAVGEIKVFKGIPYGATTEGLNRFMPPRTPTPWSGVKDALAYGPSSPQTIPGRGRPGAIGESEDCLVLNVFTPSVGSGKRPVMVWLHGGGFATGSGSSPMYDGTNMARLGDVVIVSVNHRLNVLGSTYLGEAAGPEFALSGDVGMLDIVAALQWVRENISRFGGSPNLVTIFGQSGGGRKVATLMAMPPAQGLYHRAIIESGAVLRLMPREDAIHAAELLLAEVGLKQDQARQLQNIPVARLLAANEVVSKKIGIREPGAVVNSPMIETKALPGHPWDPAGPALSRGIPLLIGCNRTEETFYDRPTPETLALDEEGLKQRAAKRLGGDPAHVIEVFRKANPTASPWDIYIFIATDHPRGTYTRELAKRKAELHAAPAFLYRFDWETPEGGGHMKAPHTAEIPFVFNNINIAGPKISQMPEAQALSSKISAAWVAFARTGNPNTPGLPKWPSYSAKSRDTMIFNNVSRVVQDPDREPRLVMEKVLSL